MAINVCVNCGEPAQQILRPTYSYYSFLCIKCNNSSDKEKITIGSIMTKTILNDGKPENEDTNNETL